MSEGVIITKLDTSLSGPEIRRARIAVTLLFMTNGALMANVLPRYPAIKDALGLTYLDLGAAVAAFPVGAIVFGLFAGVVIRRFGSARVAVGATFLLSVGILCAGLAPSWIVFASALFLAGAIDTITDVAQNAQGLRVQRVHGSSILNSFHAGWSVGAVIGGAMGAAAAALNVPLGIHLAISGALFTAVSLLASRFLLHGPETSDERQLDTRAVEAMGGTLAEPAAVVDASPSLDISAVVDGARNPPDAVGRDRLSRAAKWLPLLVLALMAIGGMIVEDAGMTWSSLYLTTAIEAPTALIGLGLIAFLSAQFVGRFTGDAVVNRFGQRTVTSVGAAVIMLGMGASLAFPSAAGTIIGFAAAGWGIATLIPAAMHAANELPGFRPGTGLTLVSWLMRLGAFSSPLIVGVVADHYGLRAGLLLVPLVGLIVLLLSPVFARRQ